MEPYGGFWTGGEVLFHEGQRFKFHKAIIFFFKSTVFWVIYGCFGILQKMANPLEVAPWAVAG